MARIAFDISDQVKQEIKVRLAREGQTLSGVMRTFCSHYKDFGLWPGRQVSWEERGTLPDIPAVYFVYAKGEIQYIGQTKSLHARLANHHRHHQFAELGASIFWIGAPVDVLAGLEDWFIETLEPPLNGSTVETAIVTRVPRWLKEKLEREAERRLAPVSQIVREAIAEKLQRDVGDENPRCPSPLERGKNDAR